MLPSTRPLMSCWVKISMFNTIERDGRGFDVALRVEGDRPRYTVAFHAREHGDILCRVGGIRLLHRIDQGHRRVVPIRRIDLDRAVLGRELLLELLATR